MAHPRVDAAVTARPALRPLCSMTVKRDARSRTIDTIRALAMDAVQKANAGHPGHRDGARPARVSALRRASCATTRPTRTGPGRDRFVLSAGHACILQYAALHLAGYDLTLDDLSSSASGARARPATPSCGTRPASRRRRGRSARASPTASAWRSPQRFLAERYNRPGHEIVDHCIYAHLLRRRPDGGRVARGGLDRRAPRARRARLRLRRQPHHDRRHDGARVHDRGQGQALRGVRLARAARRRRRGSRRAARCARGGAGRDGAAVPDRPAQPHRRTPRRTRWTRQGARRPLGDAEVRATKEIHRVRPRRSTFVVPDEVREHMRPVRRAGAELHAAWEARFAAWAAAFPKLAGERELDLAGSRATAGATRCRSSRPARTLRPATPAGKVMQAIEAVHADAWSAARPTSSSRRRPSSKVRASFAGDARRPQHPLRHPRARAWARS